MPETLEAIDRALAANPDLEHALVIVCGRCGVSLPVEGEPDPHIIAHHKQWKGGCAFAGHDICGLPISLRIGSSGMVAMCSSCGLEDVLGLEALDAGLRRWSKGCPDCSAGLAAGAEIVPLKRASGELGRDPKTVLRWAQSRAAASREGGRWMINMRILQQEVLDSPR